MKFSQTLKNKIKEKLTETSDYAWRDGFRQALDLLEENEHEIEWSQNSTLMQDAGSSQGNHDQEIIKEQPYGLDELNNLNKVPQLPDFSALEKMAEEMMKVEVPTASKVELEGASHFLSTESSTQTESSIPKNSESGEKQSIDDHPSFEGWDEWEEGEDVEDEEKSESGDSSLETSGIPSEQEEDSLPSSTPMTPEALTDQIYRQKQKENEEEDDEEDYDV